MGWFTTRRSTKEEAQDVVAHDSRIEVVAHKDANKQVVKQAKEANQKLNQLLVENGFTVKIFLAAGGKTNRRRGVRT